jgi:hypothetical protein
MDVGIWRIIHCQSFARGLSTSSDAVHHQEGFVGIECEVGLHKTAKHVDEGQAELAGKYRGNLCLLQVVAFKCSKKYETNYTILSRYMMI